MENRAALQERNWDETMQETELLLKRMRRQIRIAKITDALLFPIRKLLEVVLSLMPGLIVLLAKAFLRRMTIQIPKQLARVLRNKLEDVIQRHEETLEKVDKYQLGENLRDKVRSEMAFAKELKAMLRKGYLELVWPDGLYIWWLKRKWKKSRKTPSDIKDFHSLYYRGAVIVINDKGQNELTVI